MLVEETQAGRRGVQGRLIHRKRMKHQQCALLVNRVCCDDDADSRVHLENCLASPSTARFLKYLEPRAWACRTMLVVSCQSMGVRWHPRETHKSLGSRTTDARLEPQGTTRVSRASRPSLEHTRVSVEHILVFSSRLCVIAHDQSGAPVRFIRDETGHSAPAFDLPACMRYHCCLLVCGRATSRLP
ncbi:hypothetical protein BD310DRAFT_914966 [Dichomitus squalens]|uniref:Uncharacterized protein n=1 Tax=Dichomitus squalens TaxID=114155 RepID=A0A4Q9QBS8_9APHY|nr:hypothetical protein BD310DRAFT_914966 [Dichomitus squalens]